MPSPDDLRVLRTEVEADLTALKRLTDDLSEACRGLSGQPEQKDLAYIAYLLHGIYTGWESAMHRIAMVFENRLDPARWRAQLLQRMSLELPGIRPAVIDPSLRTPLERLRSFRHFFRHSYGTPLRQEELHVVLNSYDAAASAIDDCLRRFLTNVERIAQQSEEA